MNDQFFIMQKKIGCTRLDLTFNYNKNVTQG